MKNIEELDFLKFETMPPKWYAERALCETKVYITAFPPPAFPKKRATTWKILGSSSEVCFNILK